MTIYKVKVSALKRLAAIDFSHYCNSVRHPALGGPVMERLGLGVEASRLATEVGISQARAMDFIMTAWQAEGHAVIDRWDVRAISTLTDAIPTVLPAKYRQCAIRSIEQDARGEWEIRYDSERPRQISDHSPKDGFELIARTRGPFLQQSLNQRIQPLVAAYKAELANESQRLAAINESMPNGHAHEVATVKEALLGTWLESAPTHSLGTHPAWLTAHVNDLSLLTRPCRTMVRPHPGAPFTEVDGLAYAWVDAQGQIRNPMRPGDDKDSGQVHQTDFNHFTATTACFVPEDAWASCPELEQPTTEHPASA
ncbi:MAG: hypothetical protein K2W33_15065 [Burkholderiales bacterium]|nr:hypothetical protein [Burkholderiales bacterium]